MTKFLSCDADHRSAPPQQTYVTGTLNGRETKSLKENAEENHNRGDRQQGRLRQIWEAAGNSIGCRPGPGVHLEAQLIVESLRRIHDQLARVEQAIHELASSFAEHKYLKSIPSFGPYVSAATLAAIGNPDRFENRSRLLRLAAFDLNAKRSGEKSKSAIPVISKKGKSDLR
jgi:transposase